MIPYFYSKSRITNNKIPSDYVDEGWRGGDGYCTDSVGENQHSGQVPISGSFRDCLDQCKRFQDALGCEFDHALSKCYYHSKLILAGNGDTRYYCWVKQGNIKL